MPDLSSLYPIKIIDVYYGNIFNAQEEKNKGTRGVFIKAGQGGYSTLTQSQWMIEQCEEAGLPYGIYWVIDSRFDSSYHMSSIINSFPTKNFGQLGFWWDIEKPIWTMDDNTYWKTPYAGNGLIESVTDKFFNWCGKTGGCYTSPGFAKMLGWNTWLFKLSPFASKLSKMPLWVAQYNPTITKPELFGKWTSWLYWQFSAEPDYNYFNGNESDWEKVCGNGSDSDGIVIPIASNTPIYKVTTAILNVRPTPSTGQAALGQIKIGETVEGLEISLDKKWVKIKRKDGLVGWSSLTYLVLVSGIAPGTTPVTDPGTTPIGEDTLIEQKLFFNGKAEYKKYQSGTSHGLITYHVMKIKRENAEIKITPSPRNVISVPNYMTMNSLDICINGDGWESKKIGGNWKIFMAGMSSSNGNPYGTPNNEMAFFFDKNGIVSLAKTNPVWNSIAFPNILVEDGKISSKIKRYDVDPRTALGFDKDSNIIMVLVDGKETYNTNRTGMSFTEVASILVKEGAWIGANLDGGGSSTLCVRDENDGLPRILNSPCGENNFILRNEVFKIRSVANHFGIIIK